jgi:hypothetical protein
LRGVNKGEQKTIKEKKIGREIKPHKKRRVKNVD